MSQTNPQLANVLDSFNAITTNGTVHEFSSNYSYSTTSQSHLQGFAVYDNVYIITQNRHGHTSGYIYFAHGSDLTVFGCMDLEVPGNNSSNHDRCYNHPGGIQVIDDYLLVPIQTQDYANTIVQLYSVSEIANSKPKFCLLNGDYLLDSHGNRIDGAFGGIGIANMGRYFLLAVCDNAQVHFYASTTNNLTSARWDALFSATMADDASEVSLVCDTNGTAYMIAFSVDTHGTSYADHAYLYHVDTTAQVIEQLANRHFDTNSSSFTIAGPHFRWGAGIYFPTSSTLGLMTTQRVMQNSCKFDLWSTPVS